VKLRAPPTVTRRAEPDHADAHAPQEPDMRLTVLGCHGGELPGCRTTCLLIDGHTAIDAGALTATLPIEKLLAVDDVFLTHSHFDHVKDVPLMADIVVGRRPSAVNIRGTDACMQTMQRSVFNNELWPDFTKIPTADKPVMKLVPFAPYDVLRVKDLEITAVPVQHPVDSVGYIVKQGDVSIAISGDTGPTDEFWKAVNVAPGLKAVFVELSFPNNAQWLADVSGHFTPQTLATELRTKLTRDVPVLLYHLKPAYLDQLRAEIAALGNPRLRILELDDVFDFA